MIPLYNTPARQYLHSSVYKLPQSKLHTVVYLKVEDIVWDPRVLIENKPTHQVALAVHLTLRNKVRDLVYDSLFYKIEHHSWLHTFAYEHFK